MACLNTSTGAAQHVMRPSCLQRCMAAQPSVMLSLCTLQAEATAEQQGNACR